MSAKVTAADVCVMERLRVGEAIGPGQSSRHDASTDLPIAVETVSHAEWDLDPLASLLVAGNGNFLLTVPGRGSAK